MSKVDEALEALRKGEPVLVLDSLSREREVDMVYYAGLIDYNKIYILRKDAGGLICYATSHKIAEPLGLKFMSDVLSLIPDYVPLTSRVLGYGDKPAFSLWVNYIGVRTGISDRDRALTIRKLHEVISNAWRGNIDKARKMFYNEFISPGHVPILISRGLSKRRGHTELTIALSVLAGLEPSIVLAEMLSKGESMSLNEAKKYAERNGLIIVSGDEIIREVKSRGLQDV